MRADARIHELAYFDTLTGLANRDARCTTSWPPR